MPEALQLTSTFLAVTQQVFFTNLVLGEPMEASLADMFEGCLLYRVYIAIRNVGVDAMLSAVLSSRARTGFRVQGSIPDAAKVKASLVFLQGALLSDTTLLGPLLPPKAARLFDDEAAFEREVAALPIPAMDEVIWAPTATEAHHNVLVALNEIIDAWFPRKGGDGGDVTWRLLPYGSISLGVLTPSSDIDVVFVGPPSVPHDQLFDDGLIQMLEAYPGTSFLRTVADAFVPVIKMEMDGIEVDLAYASVPLRSALPTRPREVGFEDVPFGELGEVYAEIETKRVLNAIKDDYASVASIRGARESGQVLSLMPDPELFRTVLRVVKRWQKVRMLSGSTVCLLGGLSWAIMVGRVCMDVGAGATPEEVLRAFFATYAAWDYPEPILLIPLDHIPTHSANAGIHPWTKAKAKYHRMPVLSPCYPPENTARNVTLSTLFTLKSEFSRGAGIMGDIAAGRATWRDLFARFDFFSAYPGYIHFEMFGSSPAELSDWSGWVMSRIPALASKLEKLGLFIAPSKTLYTPPDVDGADPTASFFIGYARSPSLHPNESTPSQTQVYRVAADWILTLASFPGKTESMHTTASTTKRSKLPVWLRKKKRRR